MNDIGYSLHLHDHRRFVTFRKLWTAETVPPYLLGELSLINVMKSDPPEKFRLIGEGKDPWYPEVPRLPDAGRHKFPSDAGALGVEPHREGPYFRKVFPENMERADTSDFPMVFADEDVPYVLIQVVQCPRDHLPLLPELIDEFVDGLYVRCSCLPNLQGSAFLS